MEMHFDVDCQHEALRHRQTCFVFNREMPDKYKASPKKGKGLRGLYRIHCIYNHERKVSPTLARGASTLFMIS